VAINLLYGVKFRPIHVASQQSDKSQRLNCIQTKTRCIMLVEEEMLMHIGGRRINLVGGTYDLKESLFHPKSWPSLFHPSSSHPS
jgi:hypothetical protein